MLINPKNGLGMKVWRGFQPNLKKTAQLSAQNNKITRISALRVEHEILE